MTQTNPEPFDPRDGQPGDRRRGEPVLNMPGIVIAAILLCVAVHLVRVYVLTTQQDLEVLFHGAFIPALYSGDFPLDVTAVTRPLTYAFLHGGLLHLAVNMIWLAAFGTPLANRLGVSRFVAFWAVTGVAAVALHFGLHPFDEAPLIGASGAISGMMGAASRLGFRTERRNGMTRFGGRPLAISEVFRSRSVLTFIGIWMVVNLATGLIGGGPGVDGQIAWEAHVGGFLAGFLFIGAFLPGRR